MPSYKLAEDLQQSPSRYEKFAQIYKHHSNLSTAGPLGLLEEDSPGVALTTMLQGLTRFLLDKLAQDWRSIPPHSLAFEQVTIYLEFKMPKLITTGLVYLRHDFDSMHELPK